MNFLKRLIFKWQRKKIENNKLCDDYIFQIERALQQFNKIFEIAKDSVNITDVITWKNETEELVSNLRSRNIKQLKKAINYKRMLNSGQILCNSFNDCKMMVSKYNYEILEKRIEKGYSIIGKVEGKNLDRQQMACVVKNPHSHLVVAGAGTGKTTTIVAKVKYLIASKICNPEDILVLSFTNATASEMKERIFKEVNFEVAASTFHKLGLNIITSVDEISPNITKLNLHKYIKEQLNLNIQSHKYLSLLNTYLLYNRISYKSEFEFSSQAEYQDYLKCNPPTTIKNETVKSYGEMDIANFLYQNNIKYNYEAPYVKDTRTSEYFQYNPDFYLPDYDIYIEYFGIDRDNNVPSYFNSKHGKSPNQEYQESIDWKRELHIKNNTKMIECYAYEKMEGTLLENLEKKLLESSVKLSPKSAEELWNENFNNASYLETLIELIETLINLIKSNNYSIEKVKELNLYSSNFKDNQILLSLLEPIYNSYNLYLRENNEIDFNDMINVATNYVKSGKYKNNYKYVIIDEYQDISKARFNLINSLRESSDFNLFCVGDDWQSIYRFSGSDINFILNFEHYWGYSEISKIENTYRFNQALIEISSNFIMKNPLQIKKNIQGDSLYSKTVIGEISGYNESSAIELMLQKLEDLPQKSTVFFIGRYWFDYKILEDNYYLNCKYDNLSNTTIATYVKRKDLIIQFVTAHKSKGLQADYVFIINNKNSKMGFPSKIQDAPILELLLDNCDSFLFSEERRLFYVALTRAKKKVFFITVKNQESIFIDELKKTHINDFQKEKYECPWCGGRLLKKHGPYGEFFGCSNYRKFNCTYKRNIIKK